MKLSENIQKYIEWLDETETQFVGVETMKNTLAEWHLKAVLLELIPHLAEHKKIVVIGGRGHRDTIPITVLKRLAAESNESIIIASPLGDSAETGIPIIDGIMRNGIHADQITIDDEINIACHGKSMSGAFMRPPDFDGMKSAAEKASEAFQKLDMELRMTPIRDVFIEKESFRRDKAGRMPSKFGKYNNKKRK